MEFIDTPDRLRLPENMNEPDVRSEVFDIQSQEVLFDEVKKYELGSLVPKKIVTQYDTARNLYLYAFHVFRFYNIAQQQLYSVLELAIRDCVGDQALNVFIKSKRSKQRRPSKGLSIYMQYLKDHQLIKNSDFPRWQHQHLNAIEASYLESTYRYMQEQGLDQFTIDENEALKAQPASEFDYDYVTILCESIPALRNHFAHGSESLHRNVLIHFENISIIINKMYERFKDN